MNASVHLDFFASCRRAIYVFADITTQQSKGVGASL